MKAFAILIFCLLFSSSAIAQKMNSLESEELQGKVKSVNTKTVTYLEDNQEKGSTKQKDIVNYDESGREIERFIYDDYGFYAAKELTKYDSIRKITEKLLFNEKNKLVEKRNYLYQDENLVEIDLADSSGKIRLKQINTFDSKGNKIDESYFFDSKFVGKTIYKYGDDYVLTEVIFLDSLGNKAIAPIGPCLSSHRLVYSYSSSEKKPIKAVAYEINDRVKKSWEYVYDKNGRLLENKNTSVGSVVKFEYKYEDDSDGNWIKQIANMETSSTIKISPLIEMPSFKKTIVTIREITYFK